MDFHQINYFQTVAQVQHITRAAEQLAISQPALSRSIAKLEDELGVQLFDRKGRNIYLNRYGNMFLQRVEQAINQIEIGEQEIWEAIHPDNGTISLSFLPSLGISLVPDIISSFHNKHPNVKFQLTQDSNQIIMDQLKSRQVDIALTTLHEAESEFNFLPLLTEELFLAVSVNHPLAIYDEIDLNMAKNEDFISFKDANILQTIIRDLCEEAGFTPNVVFEGEDIGTVSGLVGARLGVSLVPDLQIADKRKVKLIPVKNPICFREVGMAWIKNGYISPAVEKFIEFIHQSFKKN